MLKLLNEKSISKGSCEIISDLCQGYQGYICGEKSVMWRNFRFLYMTDEEKSEMYPQVE